MVNARKVKIIALRGRSLLCFCAQVNGYCARVESFYTNLLHESVANYSSEPTLMLRLLYEPVEKVLRQARIDCF